MQECFPMSDKTNAETTVNTTSETTDQTTDEAVFAPPSEAVKARYKRLNPTTGGWEDAPIIIDGYRTVTVDASRATNDLPLVEYIPTLHRLTYYNAQGRVCGYSRPWHPDHTSTAEPVDSGGLSNTPRIWPAVAPTTPSTATISPMETLAFLRGLSMVVHQAAQPLIAQVHQYAEATLARERAYHEAQLAAETQRHREAMERDRQFMAALRELHEYPRDQRLTRVEQDMQAMQGQAEPKDETPPLGPYDVATAFVEHAPDIIRTVAAEVRGYGQHEKTLEASDES